ncbi:sugar phosphate isomerase/epimerase [Agrobacterium sp. SORGH_AS 745]|nr:sugar phosphate isomerase/epimerase [Agrobacterium sp. SORGH_AS_0745]
MQRLIGNLMEFCQLAERYGLAVDVENMGWRTINTYSKAAALVTASRQDNAGVLVDAIHFFRNGGNIDEIKTDIVRHVQLCDVVGPAPKRPENMMTEARAGRLAPGDGILGLSQLLNKVAGHATISVEVPLVGDIDPLVHLTTLNMKSRKILQRVAEQF